MQRTIKATPQRLIAEAEAFMVNAGASVTGRSESSVTFSARQGVSGLDAALSMGVALFDLGAASSMGTTQAVMQ
jgi:hypothetical protein